MPNSGSFSRRAKRKEWTLIKGKDFTPVKQAQKRSNWAGRADRIYRINWIEGPSAQGYLAAGEKIFTPPAQLNAEPVYPGLNFEEQRSVFNQGH